MSLIVTPTVLRLIEKARYNAFKSSVYGLIKSTDMFLASETYDKNKELRFVCDGKECTLLDGRSLSINGKRPTSGSIDVVNNEIRVNRIQRDGYCALGTERNLDIKRDCDKLDDTDVELDVTVISVTSNIITIKVDAITFILYVSLLFNLVNVYVVFDNTVFSLLESSKK